MTTVILFVLTAIVLPLALSEFSERAPSSAQRITRWTARRLGSPDVTERYTEEWLAELAATPGKLSPLVVALSYLVHLPMIRLQLRRRRAAALPSAGTQVPATTLVPIPHLITLNGTAWVRAGALERCLHARRGLLECGFFIVTETSRPELTDAMQRLRDAIRHAAGLTRLEDAPEPSPRLDSPTFRNQLVQALATDTFFILDEEDDATLHVLTGLQLATPIVIKTKKPAVIHTWPNRYEVPEGDLTDPGVLQSILDRD
ncbi:hypothetical protein GCM10010347_29720 [Streptomyces cirratus]|uniref:Uncharacterized protein n=1 Tax=Streptomyces cirratus TaxID=68187 RepID=A0ABQ3EUK0_9ACTN|nr:hypothetical protein [Streptomyces cirratus]GHB57632.1 hypothetical protein GCM10010347_29720 [Streptomyces cirratus]